MERTGRDAVGKRLAIVREGEPRSADQLVDEEGLVIRRDETRHSGELGLIEQRQTSNAERGGRNCRSNLAGGLIHGGRWLL